MTCWYLRSTGDGDTTLSGNGTVLAVCGAHFRPRSYVHGEGPALPGTPPDPDQICPVCYRAAGSR